ncbi:helix-turn-helix transcriptional regulator [Paenibacillus sp. GCM10027627]|uniref:helix-turn-helix transcriptional regulator n=1 Tax=unclassified Paenibacillus TaxID=185978 RepID=UPI0036283244
MRASRLVSIVMLLQAERKLTSKQLAERLEVTERTIVRDMEELSASGIPVYAERGNRGGWLLADGYRSGMTGLGADELTALLLVSQDTPMSELGVQKPLESAIRKLFAAASEAARTDAKSTRDKLHIDGAGWRGNPAVTNQSGHSLLPAVQEAVWNEQELKIIYEREGTKTERFVHPLGLVVKRSIWYLVAAVENGELRTFRISRLLDAEMKERRIERPETFDLAAYWEQSIQQFKEQLPRYPAQLRVKEQLIKRLSAERFVSVVSMASGDSGWIEAAVQFETLDSACEIVMSFGSGIEVLEPAELRKFVIDEMEAARMVYLSGSG